MSIRINGLERRLPNDPRVSLLDFVREHLRLPPLLREGGRILNTSSRVWSASSSRRRSRT
jgi:hypothetical protein